jgi:hypothetical protein
MVYRIDREQIGRITYSGVITEFRAPISPNGITAGPDGALWFTAPSSIGRITTAGALTEYLLPTPSETMDITSGPDGALWFAEGFGNKIGRITTDGAITEYAVPTASCWPLGITAGPDGALWFTESTPGKIGRITTAGVITEYPPPFAGSFGGITVGPDRELWFVAGGGVGEAVFVTADLSVSPTTGHYRTNLTFTGNSFAPNENVLIYASGVGSAVLASTAADANGSFSVTAPTPASVAGPRIFMGVGQSSGKLGAANFSMSPRLILNPTSGAAGSTVTVTGHGFGGGENVNVFWNNTQTLLGTATADSHGTFGGSNAFTFVVPSGASAGVHKVMGEGTFTKVRATSTFTVQ